jgi:hypothetical protein
VTRVRPAVDATPAEWVVAGLRGFAQSVLSLVPAGFPQYLRVFHPAYEPVGQGSSKRLVPVSWSEIAAANGTRAHVGMQLGALTGSWASVETGQAGVFDAPPDVGSLPHELVAALAPVLARHTSTPERIWFAVWEGFGDLPDEVRRAPTFSVPYGRYHLLGGPIDALPEGAYGSIGPQSPNLCWPDDRAWCTATEIDLNSTYVGCGDACADEIIAVPEVEALTIDPSTGIDFASDVLNPVPTDEP